MVPATGQIASGDRRLSGVGGEARGCLSTSSLAMWSRAAGGRARGPRRGSRGGPGREGRSGRWSGRRDGRGGPRGRAAGLRVGILGRQWPVGVSVHRRVGVGVGALVAIMKWHRGGFRTVMRPGSRHADAAKDVMCHALHGLRQAGRVSSGDHCSTRETGQQQRHARDGATLHDRVPRAARMRSAAQFDVTRQSAKLGRRTGGLQNPQQRIELERQVVPPHVTWSAPVAARLRWPQHHTTNRSGVRVCASRCNPRWHSTRTCPGFL